MCSYNLATHIFKNNLTTQEVIFILKLCLTIGKNTTIIKYVSGRNVATTRRVIRFYKTLFEGTLNKDQTL